MQVVFPANGTDFKLKEMYALLECDMLEIVHLPEPNQESILIVDEEGKLKRGSVDRINHVASIFYRGINDPIVGHALLVHTTLVK